MTQVIFFKRGFLLLQHQRGRVVVASLREDGAFCARVPRTTAWFKLAARCVFGLASVWAVFLPFTARADTAGIVSGTVTDFRTHAPVSGVAVVAKSPSATYHASTDGQGRYTFLSLLPDNYTITFTRTGYAAYSSIVVVLNGSQQKVDVTLSTALRTIAHTRAR